MAQFILKEASVTVGGTDVSGHVKSVEVNMTAEDVDLTAMGATSKKHAPGLRDDKITLNLFQDFAASQIDQLLSPLVGDATGTTIVVLPTTAAVSSTNPAYTMVGVLLDYVPISGDVGTASMTNVVFVPSGASGSEITRAVA